MNSRQSGSDHPECFYVYVLASKNQVLYIDVTNSVTTLVWQHKFEEIDGFTKKKRWTRAKKVALIEETNPKWAGLAEDWYRRRTDEQMREDFRRRNPSLPAAEEKPID